LIDDDSIHLSKLGGVRGTRVRELSRDICALTPSNCDRRRPVFRVWLVRRALAERAANSQHENETRNRSHGAVLCTPSGSSATFLTEEGPWLFVPEVSLGITRVEVAKTLLLRRADVQKEGEGKQGQSA
jgi:hypothetical protein